MLLSRVNVNSARCLRSYASEVIRKAKFAVISNSKFSTSDWTFPIPEKNFGSRKSEVGSRKSEVGKKSDFTTSRLSDFARVIGRICFSFSFSSVRLGPTFPFLAFQKLFEFLFKRQKKYDCDV